MRRFIIFLSIFLSVAALGYYFYQKKLQKKATLQEVIPTDAFLFYQSNTPIKDWKKYERTQVFEFLNGFESIRQKHVSNASLIELIPSEFELNFSAHSITKTDFELILYFDEHKSDILDLINVLSKKEKWESESRYLDKVEITELRNSESSLNYCEYKGWLVISKSPSLIEEVIKNSGQIEVKENAKMTIYPHEFIKLIGGYASKERIDKLLNIGTNPIGLQLDYSENGVLLTGTSELDLNNSTSVIPSQLFDYVPMDVNSLNQDNNSVELSYLDGSKALLSFQELKSSVSDTLFVDGYSYPLIKENKKFTCQYKSNISITAANKKIISNTIESINQEEVWGKSLKMNNHLNKISSDANELLLLNLGSSHNIILNALINDKTKAEYAKEMELFRKVDFISLQKTYSDNAELFDLSLTFNQLNNTSVEGQKNVIEEQLDKISYTHTAGIMTKPYIVKNHNTGSKEYLFQDSLNYLCLLSSDFEPIWKSKMSSAIVGDIKQVDCYKNGKLQYLFATSSEIHLVDRNGEEVEGFPLKTNQPINFINVFDYDHNRNYRIVTSHSNGDIVIYNLKGEQLEPWNPKSFSAKAIDNPEHVRVKGKDYIIFVSSDNKLHCLNRRGEYYAGFPISSKLLDVKHYFIDGNKGVVQLFSTLGKSATINLNGEMVGELEYKSDLVGDYSFNGGFNEFLYTVKGEFSTKCYNKDGNQIFESFKEIDHIQYYSFGNNMELLFAREVNGKVSVYLEDNLLATIEANQPISCIYSSAKDRLTIYSVADNQLNKIEISF